MKNGVPAGTPIAELAGTICSRCGLQGVRHQRQSSPRYEEAEADFYDQFAGKAGLAFYKQWLETFENPFTVLELGVGTGRLAAGLAGSARQYVGVDWSPSMLKMANAKRKRIFKDDEQRLQLVEADALTYKPDREYSHIICADGFLQHFTYMEDHLSLLRNIHGWLQHGGWLAVDVQLPPGDARWESLHRKRVTPPKWVVRRINGETSLTRQLYRSEIQYEVYVDGTMESKYRVDREYALMTPKEMALLLHSAGYRVTQMVENYGLSTPWRTALSSGVGESLPLHTLDAVETLAEGIAAGKNLTPYREDVWVNGGYPFSQTMPERIPEAPATITLIAQKVSENETN